jgi:hypothetical protein
VPSGLLQTAEKLSLALEQRSLVLLTGNFPVASLLTHSFAILVGLSLNVLLSYPFKVALLGFVIAKNGVECTELERIQYTARFNELIAEGSKVLVNEVDRRCNTVPVGKVCTGQRHYGRLLLESPLSPPS